jgi:hypothetical protein
LVISTIPSLSGDLSNTPGTSGNSINVEKVKGIAITNAATMTSGMLLSLDSATAASWKTIKYATLDANSRLVSSNLPIFSNDITNSSGTPATSSSALTITKINGIPIDTSTVGGYLSPAAMPNIGDGLVYAKFDATNNKLMWKPLVQLATVNNVTNRISDGDGNLRSCPISPKIGAYTLVASDNGKTINIYKTATVSITVPAVGVFSNGDGFKIYNQSNVVHNLTFPAGYTVYVAGTTTVKLNAVAGNVAVKARGIATVMFTVPNGGTYNNGTSVTTPKSNVTEVIISGNV